MPRQKPAVRLISFTLILAFIAQDFACAQGAAPLWPTPKSQPKSARGEKLAETFRLPTALGMRRGMNAAASAETVVQIEDAHDSLDAQKKISGILDVLSREYDVRQVALEGSSGAVDASLFRTFPDPAWARQSAEKLMGEGRLSAGEFFAATSSAPVAVYGVEENRLYRENLKAFRDLVTAGEALSGDLAGLARTVEVLAGRVNGEKLNAVRRNAAAASAGDTAFTKRWELLRALAAEKGLAPSSPGLAALSDLTALEKEIDFEKANAEREALLGSLRSALGREDVDALVLRSLAYREGRLSEGEYHLFLAGLARRQGADAGAHANLARYMRYVLLFESIDLASIFDEVTAFEEAAREALIVSEDEKVLSRLEKSARILGALVAGRASSGEYAAYRADPGMFSAEAFEAPLRALAEKYHVPFYEGARPARLVAALPTASRFYALASRRDAVLVSNTLKKMRADNRRVAALVTGGFHTRGISEILKSEHLSYLVVTPRIPDGGKSRPYLTILTRRPEERQKTCAPGSGRYLALSNRILDLGRAMPGSGRTELKRLVVELAAGLRTVEEARSWMRDYARAYAERGEVLADVSPEAVRNLLAGVTDFSLEEVPAAAGTQPQGARLAQHKDELAIFFSWPGKRLEHTKGNKLQHVVKRLWGTEDFGSLKRLVMAHQDVPGLGQLLSRMTLFQTDGQFREVAGELFAAEDVLQQVPEARLVALNMFLGPNEIDAVFQITGHSSLPDGFYVMEAKEGLQTDPEKIFKSAMGQVKSQIAGAHRLRKLGVPIHHLVFAIGPNLELGRWGTPRVYDRVDGEPVYAMAMPCDVLAGPRSTHLVPSYEKIRKWIEEETSLVTILRPLVPQLEDGNVFDKELRLEGHAAVAVRKEAVEPAPAVTPVPKKTSSFVGRQIAREASLWILPLRRAGLVRNNFRSTQQALDVLAGFYGRQIRLGRSVDEASETLRGRFAQTLEKTWQELVDENAKGDKGARLAAESESFETIRLGLDYFMEQVLRGIREQPVGNLFSKSDGELRKLHSQLERASDALRRGDQKAVLQHALAAWAAVFNWSQAKAWDAEPLVKPLEELFVTWSGLVHAKSPSLTFWFNLRSAALWLERAEEEVSGGRGSARWGKDIALRIQRLASEVSKEQASFLQNRRDPLQRTMQIFEWNAEADEILKLIAGRTAMPKKLRDSLVKDDSPLYQARERFNFLDRLIDETRGDRGARLPLEGNPLGTAGVGARLAAGGIRFVQLVLENPSEVAADNFKLSRLVEKEIYFDREDLEDALETGLVERLEGDSYRITDTGLFSDFARRSLFSIGLVLQPDAAAAPLGRAKKHLQDLLGVPTNEGVPSDQQRVTMFDLLRSAMLEIQSAVPAYPRGDLDRALLEVEIGDITVFAYDRLWDYAAQSRDHLDDFVPYRRQMTSVISILESPNISEAFEKVTSLTEPSLLNLLEAVRLMHETTLDVFRFAVREMANIPARRALVGTITDEDDADQYTDASLVLAGKALQVIWQAVEGGSGARLAAPRGRRFEEALEAIDGMSDYLESRVMEFVLRNNLSGRLQLSAWLEYQFLLAMNRMTSKRPPEMKFHAARFPVFQFGVALVDIEDAEILSRTFGTYFTDVARAYSKAHDSLQQAKRELVRLYGTTPPGARLASMGMGMGMHFVTEQRLQMTKIQRMEMKALMSLAMEIEAPAPPDASKGLEGLKKADALLREKNAVGILVGSTARHLWNRAATDEVLQRRKDIDVVVLTDGFDLEDRFQDGIDWFVPVRTKVLADSSISSHEQQMLLHVNGNGVFVRAGLELTEAGRQLAPGLYLPSREILIALTEAVAQGGLDPRTGIVGDEVLEAFHKRLERQLKKGLSPVWTNNFGGRGRILGENAETSLLNIDQYDFATRSGIQYSTPYKDVGNREFENRLERGRTGGARLAEKILDALVVGAGPGGLMLGAALGHLGLDFQIFERKQGARLAVREPQHKILIGVKTEKARAAVLRIVGTRAGDDVEVVLVEARLNDEAKLAALEDKGAAYTIFYDETDPNSAAKAELLRALTRYLREADDELHPVFRLLLDGDARLEDLDGRAREAVVTDALRLLPSIAPKSFDPAEALSPEEAVRRLKLRVFHPSFGWKAEQLPGAVTQEPRAAAWTLETVLADPFFFDTLADRDAKIEGRLTLDDYVVVPAGADLEALLGGRWAAFEARFPEARRLEARGTLSGDLAALRERAASTGSSYLNTHVLFVDREDGQTLRQDGEEDKRVPLLVARGPYALELDKVVAEILARAGSAEPFFIKGLTQTGSYFVFAPLAPIDFAKKFRQYYQTLAQTAAAA